MRQGGYSAITTQSEVTKIEGAVDHAQLRRQLKNATNPRVMATVYRGASPSTLCIQPRQIVFAIKRRRHGYSMQSGSGERVIASLNGFNTADYGSPDAMMGDLYFAGVSKTSIPLQGMPNGDYADASGIAYLISGSISIDRNSGPRRILPGDGVQLVPPSLNEANPNTNRAGVDPAHITLQTVPYDPCNHGIQLMGANAAYHRSSLEPIAPGIADVPFYRTFEKSDGSVENPGFTNQQWTALSLRAADDAKAAAYIETLVAAGYLTIRPIAQFAPLPADDAARSRAALETATLFDTLGALSNAPRDRTVLNRCRDAVYLNHIANATERIATVAQFKASHPDGFVREDDSRVAALAENSGASALYARLRWDGPALGVNGVLGAKHQVERWVIGRALAAAAPGDTLDVDIGRGRTVC